MEPRLPAPTHAVVAGDHRTVAALAAFGFRPVAEADGAVEVAVAGDGGRGRIVVDPGATAAPGPIALDVYTTDVDASVAAAETAGWQVGGRAVIELGPLRMEQALLRGPGDLQLVVIDANHRRPSRLDGHPDALHSELHSLVWQVDAGFDEALAFWRDQAGLDVAFDAPIDHPGVAEVMSLPAGAKVRMAMLADGAQAPARFELLAHRGDPVPAPAGAIAAIAFPVADFDASVSALDGEMLDRPPRPWAARAARVATPGGVVAELWAVTE